MQGKASIAGRPIHPLLVTFPIGCFVAAVVSDLISIWAGPTFWATMSTWLILFGLAGALLAAFFGLLDFLTAPMTARAKSIASWHLTLNVVVIIVFGWACAIRFLDHTSVAGYALTGLGIVLLAVSGWLGGEVAHGHLVGSSEEDAVSVREAADRTQLTPQQRAASDEAMAPPSAAARRR